MKRVAVCHWLQLASLTAGITGVMPSQATQPIPVRDFSRLDETEEVKISPLGDFIAITSFVNGKKVLAVLRLSDMKITASVGGADYQHVLDFDWVNPTRIVYSIGESYGSLEGPAGTGELFGINADGSGGKYLFGYRGQMSTGSRIDQSHAEYASARIIDTLPADPDNVLIAVNRWQSGNEPAGTSVQKMDVRNGTRLPVVTAPGTGGTAFLTDTSGFVRYATGHYRNALAIDTYVRSPENPKWAPVNTGELKGSNIFPTAFSVERNTAYLVSDETNGKSCLIAHHLSDGSREPLACNATASVQGVTLSHDSSLPLRVSFEADKPESIVLNPDHPESRAIGLVSASFPGQTTEIVSWTQDGMKAVVHVSSDRNPGDFFLLDRKTRKAAYLLSTRRWIDPEQMGERRGVSFKSADGLLIHAYLTLPQGSDGKKLPLIVLPHGGPMQIRDNWHYNGEAQLLASRGYAVIQPNFRGSGGYGSDFVEAGSRQWGTGMIDDIAASAKFAIDKGVADPQRVCIYGGSYGGYAALMSAVRYPDLYRCTVGYAGVYDLKRQKKESDVGAYRLGREYMDRYIGTDDATLAEQSPINHLETLKATVMIAHGEDDQRVPFSQAVALKAALDARKTPYEWLTYSTERHGFANEKHREEFYTRLLAFFERNIGAGKAGPTESASAPAAMQPQ